MPAWVIRDKDYDVATIPESICNVTFNIGGMTEWPAYMVNDPKIQSAEIVAACGGGGRHGLRTGSIRGMRPKPGFEVKHTVRISVRARATAIGQAAAPRWPLPS
jgi:hypothetical protein